jgi:hypothetical protein
MPLPPDIRIRTNVQFPLLVQGSGPITVNKMNGIWTIGYNVAGLAVQPSPPASAFATDYVTVYDSVNKTYFNMPLTAVTNPILLNTLKASNSANLQDTGSLVLGYNEYEIVFEHVLPTTSGVSFEMQIQSGGVIKNSNYVNSAGGLTTCIDLLQSATLGNGTGSGFSGSVKLFGSPAQSVILQVKGSGTFQNNAGPPGLPVVANCCGWWSGNTVAPVGPQPITGLIFQMSAGNIASGTIKIYGSL